MAGEGNVKQLNNHFLFLHGYTADLYDSTVHGFMVLDAVCQIRIV